MYGLAGSPRTVTLAFFGSRASARPSARSRRMVGTFSMHAGAARVRDVARPVVADDHH